MEPVRDRHGLLVGGAGQAGQENPMIAALDKLGGGASDSDTQSRTSLQVHYRTSISSLLSETEYILVPPERRWWRGGGGRGREPPEGGASGPGAAGRSGSSRTGEHPAVELQQ